MLLSSAKAVKLIICTDNNINVHHLLQVVINDENRANDLPLVRGATVPLLLLPSTYAILYTEQKDNSHSLHLNFQDNEAKTSQYIDTAINFILKEFVC